MGEKFEDQNIDMDMNNSETVFENLTILKELSNIANLVRNEDFLDTVPKAKLRRVKWVLMFDCLKQGILDEMVQEIGSMWKYENMSHKLETLDKLKEKFADLNIDKALWRPQLGDVNAQLKANDVVNLQKQKVLLESLAKEYEARVNRLKKNLTSKRGYIKALQMDIQKYQKKNEDFIVQINEKIESHDNLIKISIPIKMDIDKNWSESGLDTDD